MFLVSAEVLTIGHRGWPTRYPDNTLRGFLAAVEVADGVELDVRRSRDGKLVLSHDPSLGGLPVWQTPWSQLCELDLGDGHHPALLDEVLAALPGTPAQLEIKNWPTDPGFEPDHRLALEAAERARPGDVITGFNPGTLAAVRRAYSDVPTGLCVPGAADFDQAVKHCLDAGHSVLVPQFSLVTERLNTELAVFPWTVNAPATAEELVQRGVAGIITDDPGTISATLRREL